MSTSLSIASPSTVTFLPNSLSSLKSSFNGVRIHQPFPSPTLRSSRSRPSSVVMRAMMREEELEEIRAKTTEEIEQEVQDLKGELFMLRLLKSARKDYDPGEPRRVRKRIARMLTIRREREIENGIGRRLSRKLDKKWKDSIVPRPSPTLLRLREEAEKAAKEETDEE